MHAIVHAADVQDRDGGALLMATLFGVFPFLLKLYADGGYQGPEFQSAVKRILARVNVEIVKRSDQATGFVVLPKRWIVERTFAWLGRCRRLAKDWECLNRKALAFLRLASIRLMLRKLCNPARFGGDGRRSCRAVLVRDAGADRGDVGGVGRGPALEHGQAGDQHVRAGADRQRRGLGRYAAVDLDADIAVAEHLPHGLILSTTGVMNACPPKPGSRVMSRMRSSRLSTYSMALSGVAGLSDTPAFFPSARIA